MTIGLWEPNFERLMTVLRLEGEPDRVPFFDLFFDPQLLEPVLGRPMPTDEDEARWCRVQFMARLGYDFVVARHTFGFPGRERLLAEDTALRSVGQRGWRDEAHGPLENLVGLMGYEPLCYALSEAPDLVQAVADKIGEAELELYRRFCEFDHVGALSLNDDLGFKTQTMISPDDLRRYILPWHNRLVECAHEQDTQVILHACGNCAEVMEDLIEDVGIDAKHSFEDVIQPVAEFKRQYGSRIAVMGGIDMDVLSRGSEEEVRRYTRRVIEECAPGGGWALGTGNSIPNYMPLANFLAMLDEGRQVGIYQSN